MACFNDTHNWQTIPHRNFSYRYSDLVTKAIDAVPRCLLGDFLAPPSSDARIAGLSPPVLPNPSSGNRRLAYAPCNNSGEPSSLSQAVRRAHSEGSNKYWVIYFVILGGRWLLVETQYNLLSW